MNEQIQTLVMLHIVVKAGMIMVMYTQLNYSLRETVYIKLK